MNQELISPAAVPAREQVLMVLFVIPPITAMAFAPIMTARNVMLKVVLLVTAVVPAQSLRIVQVAAAYLTHPATQGRQTTKPGASAGKGRENIKNLKSLCLKQKIF